jgi:hypothetical protein
MEITKRASPGRLRLRNGFTALACREIAKMNPKLFLQKIDLDFCHSQDQCVLFLKLPIELRLMIYKLSITPRRSRATTFENPKIDRNISLLLSCRQVYVEARLLRPDKEKVLVLNSRRSILTSLNRFDLEARSSCVHYMICCPSQENRIRVSLIHLRELYRREGPDWESRWGTPAFITIRGTIDSVYLLAYRAALIFLWFVKSVQTVAIECLYDSQKELAEVDGVRNSLHHAFQNILRRSEIRPIWKEIFCGTRKLTGFKANSVSRVCVTVFSRNMTLNDLTQAQEGGKLPLLFLDEFRLKGRVSRKLL